MSNSLPLVMRWNGENFTPIGRFAKEADSHYIIGVNYRMSEYQERSDATHRHEFAWLREAWNNLPESMTDLYPSPEFLRKAALIEAGYYDETIIDTGSETAALQVASFAKRDQYACVVTRAHIVVIRTAKSQSRRAMGAKDFQESKEAILTIVSGMIGVSPEALWKAEAA